MDIRESCPDTIDCIDVIDVIDSQQKTIQRRERTIELLSNAMKIILIENNLLKKKYGITDSKLEIEYDRLVKFLENTQRFDKELNSLSPSLNYSI